MEEDKPLVADDFQLSSDYLCLIPPDSDDEFSPIKSEEVDKPTAVSPVEEVNERPSSVPSQVSPEFYENFLLVADKVIKQSQKGLINVKNPKSPLQSAPPPQPPPQQPPPQPPQPTQTIEIQLPQPAKVDEVSETSSDVSQPYTLHQFLEDELRFQTNPVICERISNILATSSSQNDIIAKLHTIFSPDWEQSSPKKSPLTSLRSWTGQRYRCPHCCDTNFTSLPELRQHLRRCSSSPSVKASLKAARAKLKDIPCTYCGKKFVTKAEARVHYRVHTGERPFPCSQCEARFAQQSHLMQHLKLHRNQRDFICTVCGKGFIKKCHFEEHHYKHTGQRPFKCDLCGKGFTRKDSLQRHQLCHANRKAFKCEECHKYFSSHESLRQHTRNHTGEKPFRCNTCSHAFAYRYSLHKHIQCVHSKVPSEETSSTPSLPAASNCEQ